MPHNSDFAKICFILGTVIAVLASFHAVLFTTVSLGWLAVACIALGLAIL